MAPLQAVVSVTPLWIRTWELLKHTLLLLVFNPRRNGENVFEKKDNFYESCVQKLTPIYKGNKLLHFWITHGQDALLTWNILEGSPAISWIFPRSTWETRQISVFSQVPEVASAWAVFIPWLSSLEKCLTKSCYSDERRQEIGLEAEVPCKTGKQINEFKFL